MDKTKHPKLVFAEMRKGIEVFFEQGYTLVPPRKYRHPDKPGDIVELAAVNKETEDAKVISIWLDDSLVAEAVFNMLNDYAQSKSLNARK